VDARGRGSNDRTDRLVAVLETTSRNPAVDDSPVRRHSRVSIPAHVVYREFPLQTVVLNLHTGRYLGLHPLSGRMLAALEGGRTVAGAARTVADRYGQSHRELEHDLCELCDRLRERDIVRVLEESR
jgi:Coenzyme PQQ synthesis protein D (PqqD)